VTPDNERRWSDDDIDAHVRAAVGEIESERFDELVQRALASSGVEQSGEGDSQPQVPVVVDRTLSARRQARERSLRWLAAAAVVLTGGVLVMNGTNTPRDEVADNVQSSTRSSVADTAVAAQGPPRSTQPQPGQPCQVKSNIDVDTSGTQAPGGSAGVRLVCVIGISPMEPDGDELGTMLVMDDSLLTGLAGPDPAPGTCVELRAVDIQLVIDPGECSGKGLRVASSVAGSFTIETRLLRCAPASTPNRDELTCGPSEVEPVGQIEVVAR